jgi:hypothetical protein
MEKKRAYIVVKTYPTISDKYSELVCTAGIQEAEKNTKDFRPESYRPNLDTVQSQNSHN